MVTPQCNGKRTVHSTLDCSSPIQMALPPQSATLSLARDNTNPAILSKQHCLSRFSANLCCLRLRLYPPWLCSARTIRAIQRQGRHSTLEPQLSLTSFDLATQV